MSTELIASPPKKPLHGVLQPTVVDIDLMAPAGSLDLAGLEKSCGVRLTPIWVRGALAAWLFSGRTRVNRQVMLACRVQASGQQNFERPENLELVFASPLGRLLMAYAGVYAARLRDHEIRHSPRHIQHAQDRSTRDLLLTSGPDADLTAQKAAQLVGAMQHHPGQHSFDMLLMDPEAAEVTFSELLWALSEQLGPASPQKMFCYFCADAG